MSLLSPTNEIIKILTEVISSANSNYELYNIKLNVPDTMVNENGEIIKRSENKIQITISRIYYNQNGGYYNIFNTNANRIIRRLAKIE